MTLNFINLLIIIGIVFIIMEFNNFKNNINYFIILLFMGLFSINKYDLFNIEFFIIDN